MENITFEDYWEKNQEKYINEAINKAKKEFNRITNKFEAIVSINDDGYFKLDIPHSFNLYAETQEQLVIKVIEKLNNANIVYYNNNNTARFGSGDMSKREINEYWKEMRDFIIQDLEQGETYTFIETAEVDIMGVEIKEVN